MDHGSCGASNGASDPEHHVRRTLATALCCTLAACAAPLDPTVVIVVLDGTRMNDSFGDGPSQITGGSPEDILPKSWKALIPNAARGVAAYNLGATITAPAHCALATGRRMPLGNYEVPLDGPGVYRPEVPTLLEAVRRTGVERSRVVVLANTELIQPIAHSIWPITDDALPEGADFILVSDPDDEEGLPGHDDAHVLDEALALLRSDDPPRLMLINLHQIDRSAHFGAPDDYENNLRAVDGPLASFADAIANKRLTRDAVHLFVIADHGRHTAADTDPPWQHHGDQCMGCRHIPVLALGPGVRAGETIEDPIQLVDIGATAAELLGAPLPYADGRVATELFRAEIPPGRGGVADELSFGGHTARVDYLVGTAQRTVLSIDEQPASDPSAVAVEGVAALSTDAGDFVCWREFLVQEEQDRAAWIPQCWRHDGESWTEAPLPEDVEGPFWTVALAQGPTGPIAFYAHNPNGIVREGISGDEVGMRITEWTEDGWSTPTDLPAEIAFPTAPAIATRGDEQFMVVSGSPKIATGRYLRSIYGAGQLAGEPAATLKPLALELDGWRMERPAVNTAGDDLYLAAVASAEWQTALMVTRSETWGQTWEPSQLVELEAGVLPHVTPVWAGSTVIAAALSAGGEAQVCGADASGASRCVGTGAEHLLGLRIDGDDVAAVVRNTETDWAVEHFAIDDLLP
jgi:hypothetical protein